MKNLLILFTLLSFNQLFAQQIFSYEILSENSFATSIDVQNDTYLLGAGTLQGPTLFWLDKDLMVLQESSILDDFGPITHPLYVDQLNDSLVLAISPEAQLLVYNRQQKQRVSLETLGIADGNIYRAHEARRHGDQIWVLTTTTDNQPTGIERYRVGFTIDVNTLAVDTFEMDYSLSGLLDFQVLSPDSLLLLKWEGSDFILSLFDGEFNLISSLQSDNALLMEGFHYVSDDEIYLYGHSAVLRGNMEGVYELIHTTDHFIQEVIPGLENDLYIAQSFTESWPPINAPGQVVISRVALDEGLIWDYQLDFVQSHYEYGGMRLLSADDLEVWGTVDLYDIAYTGNAFFCNISTDRLVGFESEVPNISFDIAPNPSVGPITIFAEELAQAQNLELRIFDALGQLLFSGPFPDTANGHLDLRDYTEQKGLLILEIRGPKLLLTGRLIKQ